LGLHLRSFVTTTKPQPSLNHNLKSVPLVLTGDNGTDEQKDSLDEIVRSFNEHWFQGWSATPEEQRVKFVNIANSIKAHPDFTEKYKNNPDPHNRELAFEKMLKDVMLMRRKDELELYKLFAGDAAFKASWQQSMERLINR
jgi:type I restriction enzyme R subunit